MTKRQPAATHPKATPGQLLSIARATLASKPNSAIIVKESPRFISECFREVGSPLAIGRRLADGRGFGDCGRNNGGTVAPTALAARAHARWLQRQAQRDQRLQVVPQQGVYP